MAAERRARTTGARLRRTAAAVLLAAAVCQLPGCMFAQIAWRSVPAFLAEPAAAPAPPMQLPPPDSALSVGWIGHATMLVQMDDAWFLTDPVFEERIAVLSRRLVLPGLALERVPPLTAILVSHRHFDHLSPDSIARLAGRTARVFVPPGAEADLPPGIGEVIALGAWQTWEKDGTQITAVPVGHSGGRLPLDGAAHPEAFTGYVIRRGGRSVYFPGDTSFREDVFSAVRQRFGPVDVALMPICPIAPAERMLPNHLDPEQALRAAALLGAGTMVPLHYDTFVNSLDAPGACLARLRDAMRASSVPVRVLPIGGQAVLAPLRQQ